ncbi:AraC family transcriptional regulator [Paenibacillus cymbidii]|uniref:AraC family transcriptional regulator n=1 Tax=Paenibacillus cymbidii TaxID=1639034 RepID=UPI001080A802|nr:AraC family transcriptional regulator [Paenibacillus cymbidii]
MKRYLDITNYEVTKLESDDFGFNCFSFTGAETFPHWHTHIEIIFISSGVTWVYVNGEKFTCGQGDIIFVPSNSLHSIIPQKNSTYKPIIIGELLLNQILADQHCHSTMAPFMGHDGFTRLHITPEHVHYLEYHSALQQIFREHNSKLMEYRTMIKLEIIKLFALLKRHHSQIHEPFSFMQSEKTQVIINVLDYISAHYSEKVTVKAMSQFCCMSEQHFCRTFKAYTGKTLIEFITLLRLEKSYRIIQGTDIPITHVPELTGFCNVSYFSRVFKKKYGLAPSQLRKMCGSQS